MTTVLCFKQFYMWVVIFLPSLFYGYQLPKLQTSISTKSSLGSSILNDIMPKSTKSKLINILDQTDNDIYACPATLTPLTKCKRYYGFISESYFINPESQMKYAILPNQYYDLTIKEETEKPIWTQSIRESFNSYFFQTKLISTIYERGYRQNFETFGFPGIEKEFQEASELFDSVNAKTIMDLSCGSGFMTRKFIKSNKYKRIISADLSRTMLAETRQRILNENLPLPELIRCDSARLPFKDSSFDAIHAGAAMHCWPRVDVALKEIYRVLKPGGVFYASTILASVLSNYGNIQRNESTAPFNVFPSVDYLVDMLKKAGFDKKGGKAIGRQEGRGCAILKAVKSGKGLTDRTEEELLEVYQQIK